MTIISDIDEKGININLRTRYKKDIIYVSFIGFILLIIRYYITLYKLVQLQVHHMELLTPGPGINSI